MKKLVLLLLMPMGLMAQEVEVEVKKDTTDNTTTIIVESTEETTEETTTVEAEITIDENESLVGMIATIVNTSKEEAEALEAEIEAIQAQVEAGEITQEEAEERIEAATEAFEEKMEAISEEADDWGEAFGKRMESHFDTDMDEDHDYDDSKTTTWEAAEIGFGTVQLWLPDTTVANAQGHLNPYKSNYFSWHSSTKTLIGGPKSPFVFQFGLGWTWNEMHFKNSHNIAKVNPADSGYAAFVPTSYSNLTKNRWNLGYFEAVSMLHLDLSSFNYVDDGFSVGFGLYGGARVNSYTVIKGVDANDEKFRVKTSNSFYTAPYKAGTILQVGYGTTKLNARYDITPMFQNGRFAEDVRMVSLGLTFVLD